MNISTSWELGLKYSKHKRTWCSTHKYKQTISIQLIWNIYMSIIKFYIGTSNLWHAKFCHFGTIFVPVNVLNCAKCPHTNGRVEQFRRHNWVRVEWDTAWPLDLLPLIVCALHANAFLVLPRAEAHEGLKDRSFTGRHLLYLDELTLNYFWN